MLTIPPDRDGEDWAAQRSALNKFFLKPNVINSNMSSIDEVIEDFINIYQKRMNQQGNPDGLLVDGLKNELYNLSIECKCRMLLSKFNQCHKVQTI